MHGDDRVLVVCEVADNQISNTARELLAVGRQLANDSGLELAAGLTGVGLESAADGAIAAGADKVYLVDHPLLAEYQVELNLAALAGICHEAAPTILLIGRTEAGRELGPRLAFRLGVGLAQDCLEVSLDPESLRLRAHRPVYGGNAMAVVACSGTPQMASIRPKAYEPLEADKSRKGITIPVNVSLDASMAKVKVVNVVKEESEGIRLEDAKIVISGGRGLGGPESFAQIEDLAHILDAASGASRAAVDSGWVPTSWQIGLTGKTITPDLYITVGISGASQHMAGCSGAKTIVAINKDQESNIFKEARYGVVGDWRKVLPAFTEAVRDLVKS